LFAFFKILQDKIDTTLPLLLNTYYHFTTSEPLLVSESAALGNSRIQDGCMSINSLELAYTGLEGEGKPVEHLLPMYEHIDELCNYYCLAARYGKLMPDTVELA
jgi:hypothetical protein